MTTRTRRSGKRSPAPSNRSREQAAQLSDPAGHHPGHHHPDCGDVGDLRHGLVHRRESLATWAPTGTRVHAHLMTQCDPKKLLEMLRRNPQSEQGGVRIPALARRPDARDRHDHRPRRLRARRQRSSRRRGSDRRHAQHGGHHQLRGGGRPLHLGDREQSPHERGVHRQRHQDQVLPRRPRPSDEASPWKAFLSKWWGWPKPRAPSSGNRRTSSS